MPNQQFHGTVHSLRSCPARELRRYPAGNGVVTQNIAKGDRRNILIFIQSGVPWDKDNCWRNACSHCGR